MANLKTRLEKLEKETHKVSNFAFIISEEVDGVRTYTHNGEAVDNLEDIKSQYKYIMAMPVKDVDK